MKKLRFYKARYFLCILILLLFFVACRFIVGFLRYPNRSNSIDTQTPIHILWMSNFENGNLSEWKWSKNNPSEDSGICIRPINGVTDKITHSGKYAMKMSIVSIFPHSGCRQFRNKESRTGKDLYYSAWLYLPEQYHIDGWSNIMQLKTKKSDELSKPSTVTWILRIKNRKNGAMYFDLQWDGANKIVGPTNEGAIGIKRAYTQDLIDIPVKKWFHVEMFVKQSGDYDGQIIVWQDETEIFNITNVRTKFPQGENNWSINSYGGNIYPPFFEVYVDDVAISTQRIGTSMNYISDVRYPNSKLN